MGNNCCSNDPALKVDEVTVDKQKGKGNLNAYRNSNLSAGYNSKPQELPSNTPGPILFHSDDKYLMDIQAEAPRKGLLFVDDLAFENGAVYKGYLLNEMRHGPGV